MRKKFFGLILFTLHFSLFSFSQTTTTTPQTTNPPLNERIIGKWLFKGIDEFGVLAAPDSTQRNDYVEINADNTYKMMANGKEESGTYKLVIDYKQLYFTGSTSRKTKMFTIKSSLNGKLVLDFQTPDLIHHKYTYEKI
ncbi:MAG TPA: hypothetical protein DCQ93_01095 [Bacteroidetes bacterium]|nr:hypothetical protein [Bacteroidota bacterium]